MSYQFISATYGDAGHASVVAITAEAGAVAISQADMPDAWADLLAAGIEIAAYTPPPPPPPAEPSADQIRAALRATGKTDVQIDALFALASAV